MQRLGGRSTSLIAVLVALVGCDQASTESLDRLESPFEDVTVPTAEAPVDEPSVPRPPTIPPVDPPPPDEPPAPAPPTDPPTEPPPPAAVPPFTPIETMVRPRPAPRLIATDDYVCTPDPVTPTRTNRCRPPAPAFSVGPFAAEYYRGSAFVAQEEVPRIALNYAYTDFFGINAQSFRGVWRGPLIIEAPTVLRIEPDSSWSDLTLLINGIEVAEWTRNVRGFEAEMRPGAYEVELRYTNRWHTVGLTVLFDDDAALTAGEAAYCMSDLAARDDEVLMVGLYEADSPYQTVDVELSPRAGAVFLVLTANHGVHWRVRNPARVEILGIAYNDGRSGSSVEADASVPVFHAGSLPQAWRRWNDQRTEPSCTSRMAPCSTAHTTEHAACELRNHTGVDPTTIFQTYNTDRVSL